MNIWYYHCFIFCCFYVCSAFKASWCFFRIKRDFPRIVKSICPQEERSEENIGLVLIISLISSSSRKLHVRILSSPWTSRYEIYSNSADIIKYNKVLIVLRYCIYHKSFLVMYMWHVTEIGRIKVLKDLWCTEFHSLLLKEKFKRAAHGWPKN